MCLSTSCMKHSMYGLLLFLLIIQTIIASTSKDYQRKLTELSTMPDRQKQYVLDAWLVKHAWVNPSMIFDIHNKDKILMVWKVPDKVLSLYSVYLRIKFIKRLLTIIFFILTRKRKTKLDIFGSILRIGKVFD